MPPDVLAPDPDSLDDIVIVKVVVVGIDATINFGDGPQQLNPSVYSRVLSASVGSGDTEQVLIDVQDFGEMDVSTAVNFR